MRAENLQAEASLIIDVGPPELPLSNRVYFEGASK